MARIDIDQEESPMRPRMTCEMKVTVMAPHGMSSEDFGRALLAAEMLLNDRGPLRFHFTVREGIDE